MKHHSHATYSILISFLHVSFDGHHDQGDIRFSTPEDAGAENRRYAVKKKKIKYQCVLYISPAAGAHKSSRKSRSHLQILGAGMVT